MLWTAHYYDYWGRGLKSYVQHYLGGTLSNSNYDAISTTYTANTTTPLVTTINTYYYDHAGRKVSSWEQITNGTTPTTKTLLSKLAYNEVGQLLTKNLQSTDSVNYLQAIAYAYNERGWMTGSTAPLFEMQLQYNTGTNKQYNGNIAYQLWGTAAAPNTNTYTYTYDKLNRLMGGITSADNYKETGIAYDIMGNITALNRYQAGTLIDQLAYTYTSSGNATNQLQSVADASGNNSGLVNGTTSYTYDINGNMLSSANTVNTSQNKSFTYNLLNLPIVSTVATGTATYTYDATGNKLRKVDVLSGVTKTTDYISGIEYDNSTTAIGFIQTEEGKAVPNGASAYDYTYYLGDNLGNTRITFDTKTGAAVLQQQDDYYPFGLEINRSVLSPKNEYLYNKKELQEEFQEYDYGARFYDPVIARWTTVDPLAEISRRYCP
jgi:RHS repeat-associated protein